VGTFLWWQGAPQCMARLELKWLGTLMCELDEAVWRMLVECGTWHEGRPSVGEVGHEATLALATATKLRLVARVVRHLRPFLPLPHTSSTVHGLLLGVHAAMTVIIYKLPASTAVVPVRIS